MNVSPPDHLQGTACDYLNEISRRCAWVRAAVQERLSQFKEKSVPVECSVDSVDTAVMVFKVICLLFYIVDMFLTVIDVTRAFIVSHLKLAAGKSVDTVSPAGLEVPPTRAQVG